MCCIFSENNKEQFLEADYKTRRIGTPSVGDHKSQNPAEKRADDRVVSERIQPLLNYAPSLLYKVAATIYESPCIGQNAAGGGKGGGSTTG